MHCKRLLTQSLFGLWKTNCFYCQKKWTMVNRKYSMPYANYLSNASLKYENLIILVDFNIDNKIKGIDQLILQEFSVLFSLADSIKSETYHEKANKSLINLIFTKKSFSIQTTWTRKLWWQSIMPKSLECQRTLVAKYLYNWAVFQEFWDGILEGKLDSEIRGQVIRVQTQKKSFNFFFWNKTGGCFDAYNLSSTLQYTHAIHTQGQSIAKVFQHVLQHYKILEGKLVSICFWKRWHQTT